MAVSIEASPLLPQTRFERTINDAGELLAANLTAEVAYVFLAVHGNVD